MKSTKLFLFFMFFVSTAIGKPPRLMIGIVVDQFAYHYFEKIEPNLIGGIDFLLKNGIVYKNAYVPHAHPGTSTGHVAINTGAFAKSHGIIGNSWIDKKGEKNKYERLNIDKEKYAVFGPKGFYDYGVAPNNIMVDGISDQFVLHSRPDRKCQVFAVAHKTRASVGLAGKLGKAIWFDQKGRQFTSSKAYFEKIPDWLKKFNEKYLAEETPKALVWSLFHKKNPFAYNFFNVENYQFCEHPFSLIDKPFGKLKNKISNEYSELYIKTPHANQHILDLAKECLENNLTRNKSDRFLLWISLSPLDPLGHYYGPDSRETLDMIYHLDWQIKQFMKSVEAKVDPKDILYMLTADHGVAPIIEILQQKGIKNIYRINQKKIIKDLNEHIEQKHGISQLIRKYLNPQFYFDKSIFDNLPKKKKQDVEKTIKSFLKRQSGIQKVWTNKELKRAYFDKDDVESWYKKQFYPGRSGDIICKLQPYCAITKHILGTQHKTPYEYDTHLPLILYQKKELENQTIYKKVFTTQIANTLAKIFGIAKPSASTAEPLPGV